MKATLIIALTFLMGMMLTILPLPSGIVWFRPAWVLMILLFWLIAIPHRIGIGAAFIVGLFLDLLTGTLLGEHALLFTLIAYVIVRFPARVRSLPPWQQTLLVLVITGLYLAVQYWIMSMSGVSLDTGKYWFSILTTVLLWPWLRLLLKDYQYRFNL